MKTNIIVLLLLFSIGSSKLFGQLSTDTDTSRLYFPEKLSSKVTFDISQQSWNKLNSFYSKRLGDMSMPFLKNNEKDVYRFSLISSSSNTLTISLQLSERENKLFIKYGNEFPARRKKEQVDTVIVLSKKELRKFTTMFARIDFFSQPELINNFGNDGVFWILEARNSINGYHFNARWNPKKRNRFKRCCNYLLKVSKINNY